MTPFTFSGQIRPLPYILWSLAVFFSQHLLVWLLLWAPGASLWPDWWFWVIPLRTFARSRASDVTLIAAFAYGLLAAWMLAALAFRRAANANVSEWMATLAVAPIIQIPLILVLSVLPTRVGVASEHSASDATGGGWRETAQGLVAGVALTLFGVAVSTLVFRVYGFGVFLVSPFLVGAVTAYFINRKVDLGRKRTAELIAVATLLGAVTLIAAALEGAVCIAMAAPLAIGVALVGGMLGRAIALAGKRPAHQALSGFMLLPAVFALEHITPSTTHFESHQVVVIDAPPTAVWQSLLRMDTIEEPRSLPFRLGVAYPVRGAVEGEGIGATRRGEFSTGIAIERVTEWIPERKLAFVVVEDVPSMREMSPYDHVHAPHAVGYFTTSLTSFELVPQDNSRTQVIERTSHRLRLEPILYWLPIARWIVQQNNARVLAHIKMQAEHSAGRH